MAQAAANSVLVEEGDLTRLLPRLRVGELDLIVGRLEPGYAAPDLDTEALYEETMKVVVRPDHALLQRGAALSWAGIDYGLLVGLTTGILAFIPIVGWMLGAVARR